MESVLGLHKSRVATAPDVHLALLPDAMVKFSLVSVKGELIWTKLLLKISDIRNGSLPVRY